MLSESQIARIQELLGMLAIFVNEHFDLMDPDELFAIMGTDSPERSEVQLALMETLWDNAECIDEFVRENPFDLPKRDLDLVLSWKDALPATAFFVGVEAGRELYLVENRLIAVQQSEVRREEPCLVNMTFLPFEGVIAEDFHGIAYTIDFDASSLDLRGETLRARGRGIIETAEAFVEFSRAIREAQREAELDELLAEASRESRLNAGEDISPEGFHRGPLAGLAFEERERLSHEAAEQASPVDFESFYGKQASKAEPATNLFEGLMSLGKERIKDIARHMHMTRYAALRKEDLARKVANDLLKGEGEEGSALATLFGSLPAPYIRQIRAMIVEHDGKLVLTEEEASALRPLPCPHPPLTFLYRTEDGYTLVLPADVREQLRQVDFDRFLSQAEARERAVRIAGDAVDAYGVISLDDAYAELTLADDNPVDEEEFRQLVWLEARDGHAPFDTWYHNDTVYLVHWILGDDTARDEGQRLLEDDIERAYQSAYELVDPDSENVDIDRLREAIQGNLEKAMERSLNRTSQVRDELLEDRLAILDSQQPYPRKHLYEFSRDDDLFGALLKLPAADRLAAYLNERIPDGEPDYFFAEATVEQMIMAVLHRNAEIDQLVGIALARGLEGCDDNSRRLVGLLGNLRNTMPLWELNGWSAMEELEMATGRKIFVDDYGLPLKVGRNDPCPCGSGKKYKKCCGR